MEQVETAQRLAGCPFGVDGVPFWGKLRAFMEQVETAQRLAGCSFGVSGVPFWGKLRAFMNHYLPTWLGGHSTCMEPVETARAT